MRRSKRLQAKNNAQSTGTEESSQEEASKTDNLDLEALVSKAYDFIVKKISSHSSDKEVSINGANDTSCQEHQRQEEFLALPKKFKRTKKKGSTELSSELQSHIDTKDLYLKHDTSRYKPVGTCKSFEEVLCNDKELMKRSVITNDFEKRRSVPPMHVTQWALRKRRKKLREKSAGPKWFNLPATKITPEIERDMKLLKMRNVLDRKRFYKKTDSATLPKYFQIGTVVEGAAEFYSSRIPKRQRKSNLVDELLADAAFRRYNKKKYLEIQATKQSGRRGFYKKKMNRRKPTWART